MGSSGRRRLLAGAHKFSVTSALTRPEIPLERPSGAAAGLGVAWVSWPARGAGGGHEGRDRRRGREGAAAGRALREVSASSCFTYWPRYLSRSLVELNSPQWALWGASSLTSTGLIVS